MFAHGYGEKICKKKKIDLDVICSQDEVEF